MIKERTVEKAEVYHEVVAVVCDYCGKEQAPQYPTCRKPPPGWFEIAHCTGTFHDSGITWHACTEGCAFAILKNQPKDKGELWGKVLFG